MDALRRLISAKECGKHTWREIGSHVGLSASAARSRYQRRDRNITVSPCPICAPREFSFEESGNHATLNATLDNTNLHTIEEILEYCDVDLEIWDYVDWGIKHWAVGAKDKRGDLVWEDGKIVEGHLSYRGVSVTPLWSVWVKFVRKKPIAVLPEIRPVIATMKPLPNPEPEKVGVKNCLVGGDGHIGYIRDKGGLIPFQNRRAIHAFIQVAQFMQPEIIVFDGDWLDCAELSDRYLRDPAMIGLLQPALAELSWILCQVRTLCPDSKIYYIGGNHEERLNRYLMSHAPAIYNLRAVNCNIPVLSFQYLLDLDNLGIEWIGGYPDNELWLESHVLVIHGDVTSGVPGATARKVLEKYEDIVTVFAHIHRRERANQTRRRRDGRIFGEAVGIGTLADLEGPIPAKTTNFNWQNSFGVISFDEDDADVYDVSLNQAGETIWRGMRFYGEDYIENLRESFSEFNW